MKTSVLVIVIFLIKVIPHVHILILLLLMITLTVLILIFLILIFLKCFWAGLTDGSQVRTLQIIWLQHNIQTSKHTNQTCCAILCMAAVCSASSLASSASASTGLSTLQSTTISSFSQHVWQQFEDRDLDHLNQRGSAGLGVSEGNMGEKEVQDMALEMFQPSNLDKFNDKTFCSKSCQMCKNTLGGIKTFKCTRIWSSLDEVVLITDTDILSKHETSLNTYWDWQIWQTVLFICILTEIFQPPSILIQFSQRTAHVDFSLKKKKVSFYKPGI